MKEFIYILTIILTQSATSSSKSCELKGTLNNAELEITSTNDYLELNKKYIENVDVKTESPDRTVKRNGYTYFSNDEGLFVQQDGQTTPAKIDGAGLEFANIFLDKNSNKIYLGTSDGLLVLRCGGKKVNKISVTENISVDFGVIDNIGNVYFGTNGDNSRLSEGLYILRIKDANLTRIEGIEKSLGSYTIENIRNPNQIAVDSKNNVYVGAFTSYIYLIKSGEITANKLKDIKSSGGVTSVVVDSKDNVYFRTNDALYILKNNDEKLVKIIQTIDDFNYFLSVDANDNLYFKLVQKTYVLKSEDVHATELNVISNSNGDVNTNFTNIQNIKVKNNILYLTTTNNDGDIICLIKQNETSLTEIYRIDKQQIISLAIDNNDNIYYITFSSDSQKYVPFILRKNSDIPIEIRVTGHLSHVFSDNKNNIYFGSGNGLHVLKDEEVTPYRLRATESQISSFVVDGNDNVYFGTDYDGAFVLKSGEMEATKIEGINTKFGSYVETYGDKKYDVIYFQTGGALYKVNGGDTLVSKVIEGMSPQFYLSDCMSNTYYVNQDVDKFGIFSVKNNGTNAEHIGDVEGQVLFMNSDSFNNFYFVTDKNQLKVLKSGTVIPTLLTSNQKVTSLNIDKEDNIYFTADSDVFILKTGETEATKINNIYNKLDSFVENGDNIFFITSKSYNEKKIFLLRNKINFETIFKNRDLGEIDNNNDETILNILNFLNFKDNYLLNKVKNKIINKSSTSATVLATKGKYTGQFNVTYNIKSNEEEIIQKFDLMEFLKKAVFFNYINKNLYSFKDKKEIVGISVFINNLKFSSIEVTSNSELTSSIEFKNVCFNKKRVANTSPLSQTIKIPECKYETKETTLFQITTGLNTTSESNPSMPNLNEDDENALSNFLNINKNVESKVTLSKDFNLSNLAKFNHEIGLRNFTDDEQEIIIPSKQRILVNYSVRTFVLETSLNLKQKIKGILVANVIHNDSEITVEVHKVQVTIKDAMQVLKKYIPLPNEISINEDNSITFNGRAKLTVKRESEPKVIRNFYDI